MSHEDAKESFENKINHSIEENNVGKDGAAGMKTNKQTNNC